MEGSQLHPQLLNILIALAFHVEINFLLGSFLCDHDVLWVLILGFARAGRAVDEAEGEGGGSAGVVSAESTGSGFEVRQRLNSLHTLEAP